MPSRRKKINRKAVVYAVSLIFFVTAAIIFILWRSGRKPDTNPQQSAEQAALTTTGVTTTAPIETTTTAAPTQQITDTTLVLAKNAILISKESGQILAERGAEELMEPASMTKMMTMLVAYESFTEEQLQSGTFTMTSEIIKPLKAEGAACAGFADGEVCLISDLFYGTMLPSGADAATALAVAAAGTLDDFVVKMNEKAAEIGMNSTHFCNVTGLHADGHVTTAHDIERLLEYVVAIPQCQKWMSTPAHVTASTEQHPNGIQLQSLVFQRLGSNAVSGIRFCGGKTGFTKAAGQCLASWAEDAAGNTYFCVVAGCEEKPDPFYDTLTIYNAYTPAGDGILTRYQPPAGAEIEK